MAEDLAERKLKRPRTHDEAFAVKSVRSRYLCATKEAVNLALSKVKGGSPLNNSSGSALFASLPDPAADATVEDMFNDGGSDLLFYSAPSYFESELWRATISFNYPVLLKSVMLEGSVFGRTKVEITNASKGGQQPLGETRIGDYSPPRKAPLKAPHTLTEIITLIDREYDDWRNISASANADTASPGVIGECFNLVETSMVTKEWYDMFANATGQLGCWSPLVRRTHIRIEFERAQPGFAGSAGLVHDLRALARNPVLHDVVFIGKIAQSGQDGVALVRFSGCRALLACRSEYFRACLLGGMSEAQKDSNGKNEVDLGEVPGEIAIKIVLHYCMTGVLEDLKEHPLSVHAEVHSAARRFLLPQLAGLVEHRLLDRALKGEQIKLADFFLALQRAKELADSDFKSLLLEVFQNCSSLLVPLKAADGFEPFCRAHPELAAELVAKLVDLYLGR